MDQKLTAQGRELIDAAVDDMKLSDLRKFACDYIEHVLYESTESHRVRAGDSVYLELDSALGCLNLTFGDPDHIKADSPIKWPQWRPRPAK
ncbi:hypothetical protein DB2_65 [Octadecabacter Antarctic DB virus 2]|nr:hypothetical protein DB2_65 [Octadecabacter Antarctic DB virus 2]